MACHALLLGLGEASSMFMAKLCKGEMCEDENFPFIDYSEAEDKCLCRAHPCWEDNGVVHSCSDKDFPHLTFSYEEDGTLKCTCGKEAIDKSIYIHKHKCPGSDCEGEHPILDYIPEDDKCVCRSHPCWGDSSGTVRHDCADPAFPYLRFRLDSEDGVDKPKCECAKAFKDKANDREL